jgi:hypothetical protein
MREAIRADEAEDLWVDQEHLRVDSPGLDGVRIEAFGYERLGK